MMPNSTQEDSQNYKHIKALVRDLHMTRNVARPEQLVSINSANNVYHHNNHSHPRTVKSTPCKNVSIAQKLIIHQLNTLNGPSRATIEENAVFIEEDEEMEEDEEEASDTNTSSLDISLSSPPNTNKRNKCGTTTHDPNYTIPSVVVTDINEPVDLITSTQRRFSQLYSGLRRFSTSHTTLNRCGDSMGTLSRHLLQYIESNDLSGLKTFLDTRHLPIDDRDENGQTVLMVASAKGLLPFVRELMTRGADVQAEDFDNWSALLNAAKNGHTEVVRLLVEHGADIEHRDMGGWTALMWSAYYGHTDIASILLDKGADIFAHGNFHLGSLLWAAGRGHKEIVHMLVQRGAKVNVGDKYGTTALVWACRRGNADIVEILLKAGANVDTAGMYSWTALLVAVSGGHQECVSLLLERRPNVNALDKDGLTALSIACREGLHEIASALIAAGAYVNIQDRSNDTPLIHAVKNGHRSVVELLLKRHVDVDIHGKDKKTALYTAVEKGHAKIVQHLLTSNPDLELATKDGDTPLLRAVRNRNLEIVQMLLDRRAKVTATDRRGDTALHIAMRARSKAIVEALLRNPKNSQLLYRANKAGETPYALDNAHQKTILGQVFGARRLNTNEDSEGMLGYELYSSAVADVLSEPTLTTPITVGLYAKWGSGKSFLLAKLRDEMNMFARQWAEPPIRAPWLLIIVCWHLSVLIGSVVGLATWSYIYGTASALIALSFFFFSLQLIKFVNNHYDFYWPYAFMNGVMRRLGRLRLILQVAFCHPPGPQSSSQPLPVRFHFAEANQASPTGEMAIAGMLISLFEAIENHYGALPTRLYRAFKPKPLKASASWRWRRMCCIPLVLLFEIGFLGLISIATILIIFGHSQDVATQSGLCLALYIIGGILIAGTLANIHAWAKALCSLFISQSRHLKKALKNNEGAPLTALGAEVSLMTDMVKCLDAFTKQQSRLVGIVDALDSCDTERIITVLSSIQTILSSPNRPFVMLLAVDPHVIAKAAEANSRRLFTEGGIGGHDFLRNLVHLPIYLQNSGLRKVQRAQNTAMLFRRNVLDMQNEDGPILNHSQSVRKLSNASEIMSSNEKLRQPVNPPRNSTKKLRVSDSIASSIGSNLHRISTMPTGPIDLSRIVLTDDYFSDVNPRSMRRLMNVIYITVRLLKAFQIEFSWYRLSSWINLTEQWPLRASMIVLEHDLSGDQIDDSVSLQTLYEKVRPKISHLRDAAPLLELDRDERKLEAFLQLHKHDLLVADLRIFLPFTINLDPYLRKVLKEDQQALEDEGIVMSVKPSIPHPIQTRSQMQNQLPHVGSMTNFGATNPMVSMSSNQTMLPWAQNYFGNQAIATPGFVANNFPATTNPSATEPMNRRKSIIENINPFIGEQKGLPADLLSAFPEDLLHVRLSKLSVEGLTALLKEIEELEPAFDRLARALQENAISGRVLMHCDLIELKSLLALSFGHWEIFRLLINCLRDIEKLQPAMKLTEVDSIPPTFQRQKSVIEKQQKLHDYEFQQVTLEEQMICGALQTLNEEAFEDVVASERPSPTGGPSTDLSDYPFPSISACPSLASSPVVARRDSILKHSGSVKNTDRRVSIKQNQPIVVEYLCEKRQPSSVQQAAMVAMAPTAATSGQQSTNGCMDSGANQRTIQPNHHLVASDLNAKDDDDEDESAPLVQCTNNKELTKINSSNNHS
ncbi:kinase D-interacting substrate of 220 kDa isoform X3 [Contarinia nasturtii]|uniref:kinase D-interacting substrate of 220 kDa isoform X3 n=1 Tax=Contarinia nasturtii TaxID=265458 RepID=UPI0012D3928F|nr:kinase D-interacting substrate of 220 kDa isoform X3 [Contarinia nasturtii]